MQLHGNAALTPNQRLRLAGRVVEEGWSLAEAAEAAEVSERTARKWVDRYRREGEAGLVDRCSAPKTRPGATPEDRIEAIAALRRVRLTGREIALTLGMALSTVQGILTRIGLGKLSRLEPPEPPNRYERKRPGELLHIDVKKLGRIGHRGAGHRATGKRGPGRRSLGAGWEFVHICIDDATRLAYVELLPDEKATTCIAFLRRALRFYAAKGIQVERLMTDNGSAYRSKLHAIACRTLKIKHIRTRPYRPRTNGKAERFIRTLLAGWAYGAVYGSSTERGAALSDWLDHYNSRRPHGSLGHKTPMERLTARQQANNLVGSYTPSRPPASPAPRSRIGAPGAPTARARPEAHAPPPPTTGRPTTRPPDSPEPRTRRQRLGGRPSAR
jgi:transposase InsO family protein